MESYFIIEKRRELEGAVNKQNVCWRKPRVPSIVTSHLLSHRGVLIEENNSLISRQNTVKCIKIAPFVLYPTSTFLLFKKF